MNADRKLDFVGSFAGGVGGQFERGDGTFQGPQNLPLWSLAATQFGAARQG